MVTRLAVSVVDDNASVQESLLGLLKEYDFAVQVFDSAEQFLVSDYVDQTGCLILDISMPGMTGFDLQEELTRRQQKIPIIFITAHVDDSTRLRALENGAVDYLCKPFDPMVLLNALNAVLRMS
jgi:FixJ family two-component response regulator